MHKNQDHANYEKVDLELEKLVLRMLALCHIGVMIAAIGAGFARKFTPDSSALDWMKFILTASNIFIPSLVYFRKTLEPLKNVIWYFIGLSFISIYFNWFS